MKSINEKEKWKNCECKEEIEEAFNVDRKQPSIHVRWKNNGQIEMDIMCYPDEVDKINKLFEFIDELTFEEP